MLHGDLASLLGELGGVVAVQRASLAPKVTLAKTSKLLRGSPGTELTPQQLILEADFTFSGIFSLGDLGSRSHHD